MPQPQSISDRISVYNAKVAVRKEGETMESTRLAELAAMVEMALGHPLDHPTLVALFSIQTELQRSESELETRFNAGEMTPDEYLGKTDAAFRHSMEQSRELLGNDRFLVIFGEEALHPEGMTDREAFMREVSAEAITQKGPAMKIVLPACSTGRADRQGQ